jgi:DNA-binding NarL/FixJ family response regulator
MSVRVVLVEDHALFRAGVRAELTDRCRHDVGTPRVEIVGEAADVDGALDVIAATCPDVVLLDVHLPGGGGHVVVNRAGTAGPRFLALSVSDAAEDVISVVRAGARGYVTKTIDADALLDANRARARR